LSLEEICGEHEQRTVVTQIQVFAEKQDIQTFGFRSGDTGMYTFN